MKKTFLAIILVVSCAGCSSTNISELTKSLANDHAIVSVSVKSIYGSVNFVRVGDTNRAVTVDSTGGVQTK